MRSSTMRAAGSSCGDHVLTRLIFRSGLLDKLGQALGYPLKIHAVDIHAHIVTHCSRQD